MKYTLWFVLVMLVASPCWAQEEEIDYDDFDISAFEEAGSTIKTYCNNKVLGQSPSPLLSASYDFQSAHQLTSSGVPGVGEQTSSISANQGFRLLGNFPVLSRNNILINLGFNYVHHSYQFADEELTHPFHETLNSRDLKWMNVNLTIFKPLNERTFVLAQLGTEYNGDYNLNDMMSLNHLRFPIALIYGWKPNDNLMWGVGGTHTYLGGARNLLPVVYYFQTFNDKLGVEALLPARASLRYRMNSRNLATFGYTVEGATYRLNSMEVEAPYNGPTDYELRRSELRVGFSYQKGLSDFIWISAAAGYRINWLFNVENEGDFLRGFDDSGFFVENQLGNPLFLQFSLSLVSP